MPRTWRLVREGARALAKQRVRSLLMAGTTALGVTALVVIVAFGRGTHDAVMNRFNNAFGGNTMFIRGGAAEFSAGQDASVPTTTLTIADLEAIRAQYPAVVLTDPMLYTRRDVVWEGSSRPIAIEGHGASGDVLWGRPATRGAYFTEADEASANRVALVGEVVVRELFGGRDPIGEQIRIGNAPFEVIGVLDEAGLDPHGVDKDDVIWIPISTMLRRVANVDNLATAKLGFTEGTDLDFATLDIADILRARHGLTSDQPNDFSIYTPVGVQQMVREANRTFTVFLPLVTLLALVVAGLIVANLMLLSVNERRAEIGLRKALGARGRDIQLQFLAEAVFITTVGGVAALGLANIALRLAPLLQMPQMPVPWSTAALGVALSVLVGVVAGVVPARRASQLDPVEALR